ncbi:hypothetical protein O1611_g3913 [Lasiodiplodia mahajangana]|uniref:Uncharacterized protein n=1 Tax=Lasiodiplodia mahajangana TaxID=1108764 RepID=A0ACC2JR36_9PEZI|nr:hypothetical protein O1611_g3913 [Lasiodiplodia mahajangana]
MVHALLAPKDVMDYEAVSYTWGSTIHPVYFIEIHEGPAKRLPLYDNLYHLLRDLRHPDQDRMLWIDAICINQGARDTSERNHQVQQMAEIYKATQCVLVWLGPCTRNMTLAMETFVEMQELYRRTKWKIGEFQSSNVWKCLLGSEARRIGIQEMYNHSWCFRIWILQEVANARAVTIHCGNKTVSSAIFSLPPSASGMGIQSHCQAVLDLMPGSPARLKGGIPDRDLRTLLRRFRDAKATIPHDHIYALLGLGSGGSNGLKVSYEKPILEVIFEVASFICVYEATSSYLPLFSSVKDFQWCLDHLDETFLYRLACGGYTNMLRGIVKQRAVTSDMIQSIMKTTPLSHKGLIEEWFLGTMQLAEAAVIDKVAMAAIGYGNSIYLRIILDRVEELVVTKDMAMCASGSDAECLDIVLKQAKDIAITEELLIADYLLARRPSMITRQLVRVLVKFGNRELGLASCSEATLLHFLLHHGFLIQIEGASTHKIRQAVENVESILGQVVTVCTTPE